MDCVLVCAGVSRNRGESGTQRTGLIIVGGGDDVQETVQIADGLVFVGPAGDAEEDLRSCVGLPCVVCFSTGYIDVYGVTGAVGFVCLECDWEGIPKPRESVLPFFATDLVV